MTTVSPNVPTSTFAGFRSRWMIRWSCAYARASATASTWGKSARRSASVVVAAMTLDSGRPAMRRIA